MGKGYHMMDDAQARPPLDTCERCSGELWGSEAEADEHGRVYCPTCRAELLEAERRAELADELLEAMEGVLAQYFCKDFLDTVYNAVSKRLKVA